MRSLPSDGIALNVLVQHLIRIELRTIGRQIEQTNLLLILRKPFFYGTAERCTGCLSTIKKTFRLDWRTIRFRKPVNTSSRNRFRNTMNARCPLFVMAETMLHPNRCPVPGMTGGLTLKTIGPAGSMIGPQPHLVTPVNLGFFALRLRTYPWILMRKPVLNFFRVLFKGPAYGFLRGKTPLGKVASNSPRQKAQH